MDSPLDLPALNREILLNPTGALAKSLLAKLELEQPGLECLCPLARAIHWIDTGRSDRLDAGEVLGSLWCIDDSEALGEDGDDAVVEDVVHHSITTSFNGLEIRLGFESCTEMTHHQDYWPRYLRASSGLEWEAIGHQNNALVIEALLLSLDASTKASRRSPEGYPADSGEFIGTSTYTLTSVNGLPVDGPTFADNYHEQAWENLNDQFFQRWDEENEDGESAICWLHSLTTEQAEQLGIAASGDQALGDAQEDYPAWMPKTLLPSSESFWIDADQIQASYGRCTVIVEPSTHAWIAVGCGSAWDPTDPDRQLDPEQTTPWDAFPETMGPLLKIEISQAMTTLPISLERLLPYWKTLIAQR